MCVKKLFSCANSLFYRAVPHSVLALLARAIVGLIFWQSAQTKVEGFTIKDSTYFLFEHEYALPILPYDVAAVLGTLGEHVFALMLFFGVLTRFGALGLLGMTLVIQLFVYPDAYITHGLWAIALLYLIKEGGGKFSVDYLVALITQK